MSFWTKWFRITAEKHADPTTLLPSNPTTLLPSKPPITVARLVRAFGDGEVDKLLAGDELELSFCSEGGGGTTLHCPHCERQYGIVPGFFSDLTPHVLIECPCGKYHIGLKPFGGCV